MSFPILPSRTYLVFLNRNLIRVVSVNKSLKSEIKYQRSWSTAAVSQIVEEIRVQLNPKSVRILLSDEIAYVTTTSIESNQMGSEARFDLVDDVLSTFPEEKENLIWDYKLSFIEDDRSYYQIAGASKAIVGPFASEFEQKNISVDSIEPLSYSLSRAIPAKYGLGIIIHADDIGAYYVFIKKGTVMFSEYYDNSGDPYESFKGFVDFLKDKYAADLEEGDSVLDVFNSSKLMIPSEIDGISLRHVKIDIDPYLSLHNKSDLKGKDEAVLNLDANDDKSGLWSQDEVGELDVSASAFKFDRLTIMLIALALLMALAGFMVYNYLNRSTHLPPASLLNINKEHA